MQKTSYDEHIKTCSCNSNIFPLNSRKTLNVLGDCGTDGWWDWHINEDFEYMSPRFWEILGYDPKTKNHHPSEWQKLIHTDDLKKALENLKKHIETKGEHPFNQTVRYTCANGSIKWILCNGRVIEWNEDGSPARMIGTHSDVDSAKELERSLNEERALFKEIFDNSIIGMAILSMEGRFVAVNDKFCEMLKYTKNELEGRHYVDFLHTRDIEENRKQTELLINREITSFVMEKRYLAKDDSTVYGKSRTYCKITNSKPSCFILEVEDITLKKNTQKSLKKTISEIKELISKNSIST